MDDGKSREIARPQPEKKRNGPSSSSGQNKQKPLSPEDAFAVYSRIYNEAASDSSSGGQDKQEPLPFEEVYKTYQQVYSMEVADQNTEASEEPAASGEKQSLETENPEMEYRPLTYKEKRVSASALTGRIRLRLISAMSVDLLSKS